MMTFGQMAARVDLIAQELAQQKPEDDRFVLAIPAVHLLAAILHDMLGLEPRQCTTAAMKAVIGISDDVTPREFARKMGELLVATANNDFDHLETIRKRAEELMAPGNAGNDREVKP